MKLLKKPKKVINKREKREKDIIKENTLLSSMPGKMQAIHQFTEEYNTKDRTIDKERIGNKVADLNFEDERSLIFKSLNNLK